MVPILDSIDERRDSRSASFRILILWAPLFGYPSLYLIADEPEHSVTAEALPTFLAATAALSVAYAFERKRLHNAAGRGSAQDRLLVALVVAIVLTAVIALFVTLVAGVGPEN